MTKNQVIGVNGSLPWKNLTQDKNHFINLTRNKVLIVGRKTFALEDPSLSHIRHARACIVVSRTMNQEDLISLRNANNSTNIETKVLLARSFDEAVELANAEKHKRMIKSETDEHNVVNETLDCWVAGGEAIYRDALHHSDAVEVQLTHVDMVIDTNQFREVAYFPVGDMNSDAWEKVSSCRDGELCEFKVWRKKITS
jgi:dihydrofolate reductase